MHKRLHCGCGAELKPDDDRVCNACLMKMIRDHRPSFVKDGPMSYMDHIRKHYVQDPVTKVWRRKDG
jgi:hypothetical protein